MNVATSLRIRPILCEQFPLSFNQYSSYTSLTYNLLFPGRNNQEIFLLQIQEVKIKDRMTLNLARFLRTQGFYFVIISIQIGIPIYIVFLTELKFKLNFYFYFSCNHFCQSTLPKIAPTSVSRLCLDRKLPFEY